MTSERLTDEELDLVDHEHVPTHVAWKLARIYKALAARVAELEASHPKCLCCGKLASCLGSYDNNEAWGYACGECCGHGNEDGECFPLADVPTHFQAALKWVDDANERADRAEAKP